MTALEIRQFFNYIFGSNVWDPQGAFEMAGNSGAKGGAGSDEGVIVEFHRIGNAVKVSAVDTRSLLEVSIMAPATASEREMTDVVMKKLAWMKAKNAKSPKAGR